MTDSNDNQDHLNLFHQFPPATDEEWEELIRQELKGADYRETLKWRSLEGFELLPFYRKEDTERHARLRPDPGQYPFTRGNSLPHHTALCAIIRGNKPGEANRRAREAIRQEAGFLQVRSEVRPEPDTAGSLILAGTDIQSQAEMEHFLSGIDLQKQGLLLEGGITSPALLAMLKNMPGYSSDSSLLFTYDPYTHAAQSGRFHLPEEEIHMQIVQMACEPHRTLAADGLFFHRCGATLVQELGLALAIGSEYLASVRRSDADIRDACRSFWMRLSAGTLYFPEIAKFRAARMLWSRVAEAYGSAPDEAGSLPIHAVTSPWAMTAYESTNNLLRQTTGVMSAMAGGADSVTILPYDWLTNESSDFSSRIARNIHHILTEEANLQRVADPAGGSWYLEELTGQIARRSWSCFQSIEKEGGFLQALRSGAIGRKIRSAGEKKEEAVINGRRKVIGINLYPDPETETPVRLHRVESVRPLRRSGTVPEVEPSGLIRGLQQAYKGGAATGDLIGILMKPQQEITERLIPSRQSIRPEKLRMESEADNEE